MAKPTVAQDKLGTVETVINGVTLKAQLGAADGATNIASAILCNWNGSGDGIVDSHGIVTLVGRIAPAAGDYANVAVGSKFLLVVADSTTTPVVADAAEFIKTVNGWERILTSAGAVTSYTTVTDLADTVATYTAAQVKGRVIVATPTTGRAHTLPAATDLLALYPSAIVGTTIPLTVKNLASSSHAITVTASSSITNGGITADFTVAAAATADYLVRFTNVTTAPAAVLIRI